MAHFLLKDSLPVIPLPAAADQEDRQWAIKEFREGRKDVLVATDVASKGLDFQGIQHVINYDMPTDIENYGGCGRCCGPPVHWWV